MLYRRNKKIEYCYVFRVLFCFMHRPTDFHLVSTNIPFYLLHSTLYSVHYTNCNCDRLYFLLLLVL